MNCVVLKDILNELGVRAWNYYEVAVKKIIDLLGRINSVFIESTRAVFDNITFKCTSTHTAAMDAIVGCKLDERRQTWRLQGKDHLARLRPQLAHPALANERNALQEAEEKRIRTVQDYLKQMQSESTKADEEAVRTFSHSRFINLLLIKIITSTPLYLSLFTLCYCLLFWFVGGGESFSCLCMLVLTVPSILCYLHVHSFFTSIVAGML